MCVMLVVQMTRGVERSTESAVAAVCVSIIALVGLWKALSNMRRLTEMWERIVYAVVVAVLGYLVFLVSMLLFVVFIVGLVLSIFGTAKFNMVKWIFPDKEEETVPVSAPPGRRSRQRHAPRRRFRRLRKGRQRKGPESDRRPGQRQGAHPERGGIRHRRLWQGQESMTSVIR